jgi:hypothetical protein
MRRFHLLPRHDFVIETSWPPNVAAIEIRKRIAAPRTVTQAPAALSFLGMFVPSVLIGWLARAAFVREIWANRGDPAVDLRRGARPPASA